MQKGLKTKIYNILELRLFAFDNLLVNMINKTLEDEEEEVVLCGS